MVAILELPAVRERVAPLSVEDYERMSERVDRQRVELIRGIIVAKMTSSPFHSYLIARLRKTVQAILGDERQHIRQEQPLKMFDSMPEPDIVVVPGSESDYRRSHPTTALLAIEVAVSSLVLDREKAALYAEANVQEYWIVLATDEAIEVHTAPAESRYTQRRVYERGETLSSTALPALHVELDALFQA